MDMENNTAVRVLLQCHSGARRIIGIGLVKCVFGRVMNSMSTACESAKLLHDVFTVH
jgi:hypothetical protein